jgi:hypothetical protein
MCLVLQARLPTSATEEQCSSSTTLSLLAAVRDFGMPCGHPGLLQLGSCGGSSALGQVGSHWNSTAAYFNAGVLLLNLQQWRAQAALLDETLPKFGFTIGSGDTLPSDACVVWNNCTN